MSGQPWYRSFGVKAALIIVMGAAIMAVVTGGIVLASAAPTPVTPTTVNGTLPMRMIAPTGSSSGNRLSTTVWPSTQTLVPAETSSSVNMLPLAISQLLTSRYPVEVPVTLVNQF